MSWVIGDNSGVNHEPSGAFEVRDASLKKAEWNFFHWQVYTVIHILLLPQLLLVTEVTTVTVSYQSYKINGAASGHT